MNVFYNRINGRVPNQRVQAFEVDFRVFLNKDIS